MNIIFIEIILFVFLIVEIILINKKINIKEINLIQQESDFKKQNDIFELREKNLATKQTELSEKEILISNYSQRLLAEKEEVYKIRERAQNQVKLLNQQVKKLQTELDNARQKSKRLAKKSRNAV